MTNQYQVPFAPVAQQTEERRSAFVVRVYQHLGLAVAAFMVFEFVMFKLGLAEGLYNLIAGSRVGWFVMLGGFMVANQMASMSVRNLGNVAMQYLGLFGSALAQAVIFAPFLYYVFATDNSGAIWNAAAVTVVGFAGLTLIGFVTKRDLEFMRPLLMWGGFCALGLIAGSLIFGLSLGLWFSVGMVALSGASILYQTQKVLRTYPETAHVAAAVGLFGSVMTMFWYILRIFMSRR